MPDDNNNRNNPPRPRAEPAPANTGAANAGNNAGGWRTSLLVRIALALLSIVLAVAILAIAAIIMGDRQVAPPPSSPSSNEHYEPARNQPSSPSPAPTIDRNIEDIGRTLDIPLNSGNVALPPGVQLPEGAKIISASLDADPQGRPIGTIAAWTDVDYDDTLKWFRRNAAQNGWSVQLQPKITTDPAADDDAAAAGDGRQSQTLLLEKDDRRRVITVRRSPQGQGCVMGINLL